MVLNCDSMGGPVVKAAEMALEMENVNHVLPYVSEEDEEEVKYAFEKAARVRELNENAAELADYWFFETVTRLHLKAKNEPFNGIKPLKTNLSPIMRKAKMAMEEEDLTDIVEYLSASIENEIRKRFMEVLNNKDYDLNEVDDAREYVNSVIEFVYYVDHIQNSILLDNKK
jgi:hypothetical protein